MRRRLLFLGQGWWTRSSAAVATVAILICWPLSGAHAQSAPRPRAGHRAASQAAAPRAPACSRLKVSDDRSAVRRSEAALLRSLGIARSDFQVNAIYTGLTRKLTHLRIVRRVYYPAPDGPAAKAFRVGLILPGLDQAALDVAKNAGLPDLAFGAPRGSYAVYVFVSLFSDPDLAWPDPPRVELLPGGHWSHLLLAAAAHDEDALAVALRRHPPAAVLAQAMFYAMNVGSVESDSSSTVILLLRAGADANANLLPKLGFIQRPLMLAALGSPCAIRVLLQSGARLGDRDENGRTALDLARQAGQDASVAILEAAERASSGGGI
jgi:hypothetical protein